MWSKNFDEKLHRYLNTILSSKGYVWSWPPSNTRFLGLTGVSPQTACQSVQLFLHSSPMCQTHKQTVCDIC